MYNQPASPPPPGFASAPPPYYANPPYPQPPPPHYANPGMMPPVQQQPQQPPVIVNVAQTHFGPNPQRVVCPYCQNNVITRIEQNPSTTTHLAALFLCCTDWWACAPCLYCCECCHSKKHYCPNCNNYLGKYD